jgi:hypothetical protein
VTLPPVAPCAYVDWRPIRDSMRSETPYVDWRPIRDSMRSENPYVD